MPLKTRITFIFILLTGVFQIAIFLSIYFFSKDYTESEFYKRLGERATIAGQVYLEKDELTIEIYEAVRIKHLQTLPFEKEKIYPFDPEFGVLNTQPKDSLPMHFFKMVIENNYAELKQGETYYTGLLYNDNQGDFIVIVSARDLYGKGKLENLRNILVLAFLLSMIVISILGQYFAEQALKPISRIIKRVNTIKAENLNLRLEKVNGRGELADLTQTFNNMLDRLETSFEMKSNFVQNASHELKNPLTAIIGQAEMAIADPENIDLSMKALQAIKTEGDRLNRLLNVLFKLAYNDPDSKDLKIDLIRIDEVLIGLKSNFENEISHRLNYNFQSLPMNPDDLIFRGNIGLIEIALMNILDNALKYSKEGDVYISVKVEMNTIIVEIEDRGIGIPFNDLKNVFEPFYRGGNTRSFRGFGFGLPLSNKIVRLHGGLIRIHSEVEQGTCVRLEIPNISKGYEVIL
ncbi:sensor histidine kinase [Robertkochia marina]|nr:HAMP domain-containing sensor histidine kinase [Robertkochia marina]